MRRRDVKAERFGISKHRYRELRNFCLQYPEWRDELKYKSDTLKSPALDGMPRTPGRSDGTADLAVRRAELQRKCEMVESAAREAAGELGRYIIENVSHEDKGYSYLRSIMGIPMGQRQFYDARRIFYCKLDQKHKVG